MTKLRASRLDWHIFKRNSNHSIVLTGPSLRTSMTGEIVMNSVEVVEDAMLPGAEGPGGSFSCLD